MAVILQEPITVDPPPPATWIMSSVNVAEVCTLLSRLSPQIQDGALGLLDRIRSIRPFTEPQARKAGELVTLARNLSLGNRARLALALDLQAEIYTADRAWATLDLGLPIHLIR